MHGLLGWGFKILTDVTQKFARPSPLAPLPKGESRAVSFSERVVV